MAIRWSTGKDITYLRSKKTKEEIALVCKYIDYSWGSIITSVENVYASNGEIKQNFIPSSALLFSNILYISSYGLFLLGVICLFFAISNLFNGYWLDGMFYSLGIVVLFFTNWKISKFAKKYFVSKYFTTKGWEVFELY